MVIVRQHASSHPCCESGITSPFYRWRSWGSQKLSDFPGGKGAYRGWLGIEFGYAWLDTFSINPGNFSPWGREKEGGNSSQDTGPEDTSVSHNLTPWRASLSCEWGAYQPSHPESFRQCPERRARVVTPKEPAKNDRGHYRGRNPRC